MKFTISAILSLLAFGFMLVISSELSDRPEGIMLAVLAGGVEAAAMIFVVLARASSGEDRMTLGFIGGIVGLMASCAMFMLAQGITLTSARYGVVVASGMLQMQGFIGIVRAMRRS